MSTRPLKKPTYGKKRRERQIPELIKPTTTIPNRPRSPDEPPMFGYARVSMDTQNAQRQIDDLVTFGVGIQDVFVDVGTGAHMDRQGWNTMLGLMHPGDLLVIHSIDRLSRDLVHTMTTLKELNQRGIRVKVLTMDFDSQTPMGRFVFAMMAAFSQFERDVIIERTMHGLERARARGVMGGSKQRWTDEQIEAAVGEFGTWAGAARKLKCAEITVKRRYEALMESRIKGEAVVLPPLEQEPEAATLPEAKYQCENCESVFEDFNGEPQCPECGSEDVHPLSGEKEVESDE